MLQTQMQLVLQFSKGPGMGGLRARQPVEAWASDGGAASQAQIAGEFENEGGMVSGGLYARHILSNAFKRKKKGVFHSLAYPHCTRATMVSSSKGLVASTAWDASLVDG